MSQIELPPAGSRVPVALALIASPAVAVRRRWSQRLQGMVAIQEVAKRAALERNMATLNPAILLLDLALPHLGIEGVPTIQRLSPSTQIVLFSSNPDEREAISALKAGARGYHSRDIDPYLLKKAIQLVQKGEIWVGRNVIPHLLKELTSLTERRKPDAPAGPDGRLDRLTPREREITHLIGNGASNKEIASQLKITEKTVKAHLTAIFRKLGLSDRLRLALFVLDHNRMSR